MVKTISLGLAFALSAPTVGKTILCFNSTLQSIYRISSDLKKLLKYFNGVAIVSFFRVLFAPSASGFPNNLALYLKDLKLLLLLSLLAISEFKLPASSFKKIHKPFVVSESYLSYILLDCTLEWLNLNL